MILNVFWGSKIQESSFSMLYNYCLIFVENTDQQKNRENVKHSNLTIQNHTNIFSYMYLFSIQV